MELFWHFTTIGKIAKSIPFIPLESIQIYVVCRRRLSSVTLPARGPAGTARRASTVTSRSGDTLFDNCWEHRNMDYCINTGDDSSMSDKNFVNFRQ